MNGYLQKKMLVFGAVMAVLAVSYGYPMGEQGKNLISGVFIPSEAFKNLQDRANANMQNNQPQNQGSMAQPVTNPQPTYQPMNNNPQQYQYQPQQTPVMTNPQPALTNQPLNNQPINTQPMTTQPTMQPVLSNQPTVLYAQQMAPSRDPNSNQPILVMTNQPTQPNNQRPIVYVQQPATNQPIYVQPSQPTQYVLSNGQPNQPTQIVIANPSNGTPMQNTMVSTPNQNQPVYTLIPLTPQNNGNTNTGSYFIPVQSGTGNTNPIILNTSH